MELSESHDKKRRIVNGERNSLTETRALSGNHAAYLSIAKIAPPKVLEATQRPRLFRLLDRCAKAPVTWVSAPLRSGQGV